MAINTSSTNGQIAYNIKEFICDTPTDLQNLPSVGIGAGSTAFVISTKELYMINSTGTWVKL